MRRREFLSAMAAAVVRRYRVAIIGATGRGNYGHDWDLAWNGIAAAEVVAVADSDAGGRAAAVRNSHAGRSYADYREMLASEKPDIVTICPRWLDQRVEMFMAAANAGAHILMEKPFAANLENADRMVAESARRRIRVQVGHTARAVAVTTAVRDILHRGELGTLMEMRARGKEDARAGGEDMMVLGTHAFDLMRYFAGDPLWVFADILQDGRKVGPNMSREPSERIGKVAGDDVAAMFRFGNGVPGYFNSKTSDVPKNDRFGVTLYGSKGCVFLPLTDVPSAPPYLLRKSSWAGGDWERVTYPAGTYPATRAQNNALMATDLIDAVETRREPMCGARDGRWTIEMLTGIYQSQMSGARVDFPLKQRRGNPL